VYCFIPPDDFCLYLNDNIHIYIRLAYVSDKIPKLMLKIVVHIPVL